jgi:hypothetical protein
LKTLDMSMGLLNDETAMRQRKRTAALVWPPAIDRQPVFFDEGLDRLTHLRSRLDVRLFGQWPGGHGRQWRSADQKQDDANKCCDPEVTQPHACLPM